MRCRHALLFEIRTVVYVFKGMKPYTKLPLLSPLDDGVVLLVYVEDFAGRYIMSHFWHSHKPY